MQVAEGEGLDVFCPGVVDDLSHPQFIVRIGAGPGQRDFQERQLCGRRLCPDQFHADAVHGNAVRCAVKRGDETSDFNVGMLTKHVQHPGAVLAGTPEEQGLTAHGDFPETGLVEKLIMTLPATTADLRRSRDQCDYCAACGSPRCRVMKLTIGVGSSSPWG